MSATTLPAAEGKSLTPRERRKRRRDPELSSQSSLKDVLTVVHSTQPEESVKDPCVVQADQGPTSEIKEAEKDTLKQSEPIDESNAVSHPQSSVPDLMESTRQSQSQDCTVESPGSSEDEFFTPPSSPNYLDEPLHCWAEDLIERYYKSPGTWKPKPLPKRDANGRTEAERLFALLEERFYSDMTREQEMELFFGTKRTPKVTTQMRTENDAPVVLEKQNSCSSSVLTEETPDCTLRRSKRSCKGKRASCIGCESCFVSVRFQRSSRKRKNPV